MSERVLTIDLGNSRCKLVLWERADLARPGAEASPWHAHDERELSTPIALSTEPFARFLEEWFPRAAEVARIGLSSVAALSGEAALAGTVLGAIGE